MAVALSIILFLIHLGFVLRVLSGPARAPASRSTWVLTILLFPILGPLAYLLFGERYMPEGKRRAGRAALVEAASVAQETAEAGGVIQYPDALAARDLAALIHKSGGMPPVSGNKAALMADSNAAMEALAADIDAASMTVHLSFYIWLADHNGLMIKSALVRAAGRGVKCRVMADAIGSRSFIDSRHWTDLERAGVHLVRTLHENMIAWALGAGRMDLRDHRKIMVIDNRITFIGSQNCADPEFRMKPRYAPWVDMMVRFEGPVARAMQALFLSGWMVSTGEDLTAQLAEPLPDVEGHLTAQGMGCGPFDAHDLMSSVFVSTIYAASRSLCISTPYFVPDAPILEALATAARRGVVTDLILPRRNDSKIVRAISQSHYAPLLAAGVHIHEYQGGLLHAKTMTVDDTLVLFGSANLDHRSLELNFENNVLVYDGAFTATIRARQQDYLASSIPIEAATVARWSLAKRIWCNALSILGPVF